MTGPRLVAVLAFGTVLLAGACAPDDAPGPGPGQVESVELPPEAPRLILFLVIDMGAPEQLARHRPLFNGGLARLMAESASFTDAHHFHADTDTSAGHATLATGRHPRSHGSPYPHDTHVPWLVRGAGIAARELPGRVATVDVAPTVAGLVGLPVPDGLDGVDRSEALRGGPE